MTTLFQTSFALAFTAGLGLFSSAALAGSGTYDTALAEKPCNIVSADMVATTFDVPVDSLQQYKPAESWCHYMLEENGRSLEFILTVVVFDTEEAAEDHFDETTRSMSENEMAERLEQMFADDGDDPANAAEMIAALPANGIQFEDIDDLADQARFQTDNGTLNIRQSNMVMKLNGFHGPSMKMPGVLTVEAVSQATAIWKLDTMSLRRQSAMDIAKMALAAL